MTMKHEWLAPGAIDLWISPEQFEQLGLGEPQVMRVVDENGRVLFVIEPSNRLTDSDLVWDPLN